MSIIDSVRRLLSPEPPQEPPHPCEACGKPTRGTNRCGTCLAAEQAAEYQAALKAQHEEDLANFATVWAAPDAIPDAPKGRMRAKHRRASAAANVETAEQTMEPAPMEPADDAEA